MDLGFLKTQWAHVPYPQHSFDGQTVIVTGSNTGLGLEAARHFARLGAAKIILGVRTISKGEEAARSIEKTTGRENICEVWQLDMGDFESVKAFAKKVEALDRLDVVLENAGVAKYTFSEMSGMETTIAVNVIGTFLLALNLLPVLRKSGKEHGNLPRLVVTTSEVHAWSKMAERHEDSIFDALKKDNKAYIDDRYQTSKLLEVFAVRALAEKMSSGPHSNEKVILNCVNPGLCHSSLAKDIKGIQGLFFGALKLAVARTTEVGSRTLVAGAVAGEESHGCYMDVCSVSPPSPFVRSDEGKKTQERVYKELMDILEEIQPGITNNI